MMILLDMKMPESCSDCELRFCGICEQGLDKEPCPIKAEIPDGATNGDVIKALFPNIQVKEYNNYFMYYSLDEGVGTLVEKKWWNAPYEGIKK